MRDQLKQIIILSRGMSAWDELVRTEADIRKKRQQAIYAQEERRRFWLEMSALAIAVIIGFSFIAWIIWLYMKSRGFNLKRTYRRTSW